MDRTLSYFRPKFLRKNDIGFIFNALNISVVFASVCMR